MVSSVRNLSVSVVKTYVILTFRCVNKENKKKITTILAERAAVRPQAKRDYNFVGRLEDPKRTAISFGS